MEIKDEEKGEFDKILKKHKIPFNSFKKPTMAILNNYLESPIVSEKQKEEVSKVIKILENSKSVKELLEKKKQQFKEEKNDILSSKEDKK